MKKETIKEIEQYFTQYKEGIYRSPYYGGNESCKKCFHKEEDSFHIAIFDNGEVYQLNSDHRDTRSRIKNTRAV